ncbi:MAG: aminotransferase class I/II-fold pyridoxal phosphate-dependent enzyme [Eubacteriales bacterium]
MQHFDSDYMEGAHPKILEKLMETNMEKTSGYGTDAYCESAANKIKVACNNQELDVYFLVGGTQTNATVIDTFLRSYEGVIAATTGHISVHEAGAIEFCGHKVLTLPHTLGKIAAADVEEYFEIFNADGSNSHMVSPGMVYISHPTEYGTLYTKEELEAMSAVCKKHNIPLFLDGARLGYGLAAKGTDVTLELIASLCDAFYIGGTKVGALFGEAVVISNKERFSHFITIMKQHGALLAKGRMLGIQFDVLFTDDLYGEISAYGIAMAEKLKKGLVEKGCEFYLESPTNQQFIIIENTKMEELSKDVTFTFWERYDDTHSVIRFVTSWATKAEDIDVLIGLLD